MTVVANTGRSRIHSIDILRGLVMVIMALDHVRDFFHKEAFTDDPMNLDTTTLWLYFTRWITHFCAPVFIFLAGTSAFLMGQKKTKAELSWFLIKRGLWLILIEVLIISFGWSFNPFYNVIFLQVIWAIGISMVILGLLVRLPFQVILAVGLVIVVGHNLLDYYEQGKIGQLGLISDLLHSARFSAYKLWDDHFIWIVYPFLPWTGLMALGYCFGTWFKNDVTVEQRQKKLIRLGLSLIALFILLRLINAYGDPSQWSSHPRGVLYSFFSFMNVQKYPPSLMFLCATLGPAILFLAFLEKMKGKWTGFFLVYGKVPFFYYVLHFYIIHIFCVIAFFADGYSTSQIVTPGFPFLFRPPTFGFDLWVVYAVWIATVLVLYPLCKWYGRYKATHKHWWLSYV